MQQGAGVCLVGLSKPLEIGFVTAEDEQGSNFEPPADRNESTKGQTVTP